MTELPGVKAGRRGPGRPVSADSAGTRANIVRAGREVVNERGYAATTFQAIAKRTGLSRPTLNYYFPSREALFEALVAEAHVVVDACIEEANQHESPVNRLRAFMLGLLAAGREDPSLAAFLTSARLEAHRHPVLPVDTAATTAAFLADATAEAVARRELPPHVEPGPLAELLHAILWGIGACAGSEAGAANFPAVAKQLELMFDYGLLADGADSR
ncbi:hypothetical protein EB73_29925 [Mycobacterium sp. SWH-M3]|nr:hypothetical protein EB73_29925 [Mycobacterium sp. SWH-M3]